MYASLVVTLMLVMPIGCTLYEVFHSNHGLFAFGILLKWFVFWAVGARLLLAGFRQIFQPAYTAAVILRIRGDDCRRVIRELGFSNMAIGVVGAGSLFSEGWLLPAAIAGTVLYGFAGVNHFLQKARGTNENVAMVSDVLVAVVLIVCLLPS
jgi:uncharacterized membrane protein YkvI